MKMKNRLKRGEETDTNRCSKIMRLVSELALIIGYEGEIKQLKRVTQSGDDIVAWDFFDAVHSEMGVSEGDKRGYIVEIGGGRKLVISVDGSLSIPEHIQFQFE